MEPSCFIFWWIKYLITFIDYFFVLWIYIFVGKKSQATNALKVYVNEVEIQLDRKEKIIRSYRYGEYYGKYNRLGHSADPFAKFLEEHDVCE